MVRNDKQAVYRNRVNRYNITSIYYVYNFVNSIETNDEYVYCSREPYIPQCLVISGILCFVLNLTIKQ